jgi:hypothetical protein
VNRKFRELAGDSAELAQGPLSDLCSEDFSYSTYQALMLAFEEALTQDEMEPLEYLEQHTAELVQKYTIFLEMILTICVCCFGRIIRR